ERKRFIAHVTYEHPYIVAGYEYLDRHDQTSAKVGTPDVHAQGYSIWATPRSTIGWEGLLRYDHYTPNTSSAFAPAASSPTATTTFDSQKQNRYIFGVAYWFPHQGNVSAALMLDYDGQSFDNITTAPTKSIVLHALINF